MSALAARRAESPQRSAPPCPALTLAPAPEPAQGPRLPCRWIRDGGLRAFRSEPAHAGRSTAALKLLLTIAAMAETGPGSRGAQGSALLSYSELAAVAGLSQPLIHAGKKLLCALDIMRVEQEGARRRSRYVLADYDDARGCVALPFALTGADALDLPAFSCRRVDDLHALKVFVLLVAEPGLRRAPSTDFPAIQRLTNTSENRARIAVARLDAQGRIEKGRIDPA